MLVLLRLQRVREGPFSPRTGPTCLSPNHLQAYNSARTIVAFQNIPWPQRETPTTPLSNLSSLPPVCAAVPAGRLTSVGSETTWPCVSRLPVRFLPVHCALSCFPRGSRLEGPLRDPPVPAGRGRRLLREPRVPLLRGPRDAPRPAFAVRPVARPFGGARAHAGHGARVPARDGPRRPGGAEPPADTRPGPAAAGRGAQRLEAVAAAVLRALPPVLVRPGGAVTAPVPTRVSG